MRDRGKKLAAFGRTGKATAPKKADTTPAGQAVLDGELLKHPGGTVPLRSKDMKAEHHAKMADYHEKMSEWSKEMGRHKDSAGHATIAQKHRKAEAKKLQRGEKGGTYYVSKSGEKVYVN